MNITAEVIDWTYGRPAEGVAVRLERQVGGIWEGPVQRTTDENGRLEAWKSELEIANGLYRLEFDTDGYYATLGIVPFYPKVTVTFRICGALEDCHLPVIVTPYGYLTYRVMRSGNTAPQKQNDQLISHIK